MVKSPGKGFVGSSDRPSRMVKKLGVVLFCRKMLSNGVVAAASMARILEFSDGPRPIRPLPAGLEASAVTSTINVV